MADDFGFDIDTSGIDKFMAQAEADLERAYGLAARNTAQEAATNTVRIDTGTMQNSWMDKTLGALDYLVGAFGCSYAIFHEFGTTRLAPSPMLIPAFEHQKRLLLRSIQGLGKKWTRQFGGGR